MKTHTTSPDYKGFRFSPEMISHAVWLYFRFSLSFRDVEELLAQRGIIVTYETVRQWCLKFGQTSANEVRRRRPRCRDTWHMDEMVLTIQGKKHSLWRAVDQDGNVLDNLVQSRRNKKAASDFSVSCSRVWNTCCACSSPTNWPARPNESFSLAWSIGSTKGSGIRAEHSYQPTRQRERTMRRFKSAGHAQRFLSACGPISDHVRPRQHRLSAAEDHATMQGRFQVWNEVTGVHRAA